MSDVEDKDLFDLAMDDGWTEEEFADQMMEWMFDAFDKKLEDMNAKGVEKVQIEFNDAEANYKLVITAHKEPIIQFSNAVH